uniref:D-isomer specific 2-hydroxyacid dehydrogenase catalytic domain-containing protein n=1 Tax=Fagus sylvatica TaxID=28930 RepID=A0A2N9INH6_FAGSY
MYLRRGFVRVGGGGVSIIRNLASCSCGNQLNRLHSNRFSSADKLEIMAANSDKNLIRVLFCGPYFPASHNYTREYLQKYPFVQVDDVPFDDVPNVIANYHLCVAKDMKLDSNVLSRATQMKVVMQYGVGVEGIDINAATKYGIKVARIPGDITGNAASCAEMAIYLILGLLRKQNEMQIAVNQRKLGEPVGETLFGKTKKIPRKSMASNCMAVQDTSLERRNHELGENVMGAIGNPVAEGGNNPLGMVQRCWLRVHNDLVDEKGGHEDIHKFASNADIVVCCLSLNRQTGAILVNIARGGLLDYEAVLYHLKSGHLGGLGIDVSWSEPFDPDDPILKFKNVVITPHVAGVTEHSYRSMAKVVGDVALQLHAGAPFTGIEFVN